MQLELSLELLMYRKKNEGVDMIFFHMCNICYATFAVSYWLYEK